MANDFSESGYIRLNEPCNFCNNPHTWKNYKEEVCPSCYTVQSSNTEHTKLSKVEAFLQYRVSYRSGYKKCVGGFLNEYDWGSEDETFTY